MSLYKIGTCNYCDEKNQILRPSPFMADTKAMMCEYCWNETQKEYSASNGEHISNFDSNKSEYEDLKKNGEMEMGSITDEELNVFGKFSDYEKNIIKEQYSKYPKGTFPNPRCALY